MDIEELKREKCRMDESIRSFVVHAVRQFEEKTGFTPSSIDIEMLDVTTCGFINNRYAVGEFVSKIDIF